MDFFNKLGKKTNEVYQGAKEKTVKISEEIKIRTKISDLKDKIEDELLEIGKVVYEKMKNGDDASKEEIAPKCEEVSRLNYEIEKLETELLALKKLKKCVNCSAELDQNADFCSKCGTAQPKTEEVEVKVAEEPTPEAKEVEATEVIEVQKEITEEDKKEEF